MKDCSENLNLASTTLGISLVSVVVHGDHRKDIRAHLPNEVLLPELTLADVLFEELQLDVPETSVVLFVTPTAVKAAPAVSDAFTLVAEAFYAKLRYDFSGENLSLLVWGLRSFAKNLSVSEASIRRVICALLDAPRGLSQEALSGYLRQLDPEFREYEPNPDLSGFLRFRGGQDWSGVLRAAFEKSAAVEADFQGQHE